MDKRGLNTIVSTVLIILIIIIAIILLWFFLREPIVQSGEDLSTLEDCIKIQVEPVTCLYSLEIEDEELKLWDGNTIGITLKRNPATGPLTGLKFIFTDEKGDEIIFGEQDGFLNAPIEDEPLSFPLPELAEQSTGGFNLSFVPETLNVGIVVGSDLRVCNPTSEPIKCELANFDKVCVDCNNDGAVTVFDGLCYFGAFTNEEYKADTSGDGLYNIYDYINLFNSLRDPSCNCEMEFGALCSGD